VDLFKEFYLERIKDVSGISGTGIVARGMVYPSGKVVLEWQTFHTSICIYNNLADVQAIHGHGDCTLLIMGNPHEQKTVDRVESNAKVSPSTNEASDEAVGAKVSKKKKPKMPKPRIPVPKPGRRHPSKKDYKRDKRIKEDQE